jgi:hypothetical protein
VDELEMFGLDDNIDLDALFDSLNIDSGEPKENREIETTTTSFGSEIKSVDIHESSALDDDLFQFDNPVDQS